MDYGIPIAAIVFAIVVAYVVHVVRSGDLTRPEPQTPRPEPVEIIDWKNEWRPVGGPPRWKDVRLHD